MKDIVDIQRSFCTVNSKESLITSGQSVYQKKRYNKITQEVKAKFMELIINNNCSIKKAAEILNINYSSSKSIFSSFRKQSKKAFKVRRSKNSKFSDFKEIVSKETFIPILTLCTSIGRQTISQSDIVLQTQPIKKLKIYHVPDIIY